MAEFEMEFLKDSEELYTFSQSTQISAQTGLIGHLRADMDKDGESFFSSWEDYRKDLKTDEFKAELDEVMGALREENGILHGRRELAKSCHGVPESKMECQDNTYGMRINTDNYAYMFRLDPRQNVYNVYCYCYRRDWLDEHIKQAKRGIRFIDPHYKEKFRIPDGGKVKIHFSWGEDSIEACRYIDDYHVEVGRHLYHICEFAERMEENGHTVEPAGAVMQKNERNRGEER